MSRVVLATRNAKKLGELARILGGDVQVLEQGFVDRELDPSATDRFGSRRA